jgi:hypothetical protein
VPAPSFNASASGAGPAQGTSSQSTGPRRQSQSTAVAAAPVAPVAAAVASAAQPAPEDDFYDTESDEIVAEEQALDGPAPAAPSTNEVRRSARASVDGSRAAAPPEPVAIPPDVAPPKWYACAMCKYVNVRECERVHECAWGGV